MRRIVAIVLPRLLCELAAELVAKKNVPSAVVLTDGARPSDASSQRMSHSAERQSRTEGASSKRWLPAQSASQSASQSAPHHGTQNRTAPHQPDRRQSAAHQSGHRQSRQEQSTGGQLSLLADASDEMDAKRELEEQQLQATTRIDAVNDLAKKYGVRAGQTIAESRAILAHLRVAPLPKEKVRLALQELCESVLRFGTSVSFELPDTVWLDISGVAHLFGGEKQLTEELFAAVSELGYTVRIATSAGPMLAQAYARWLQPASGQLTLVTDPTDEQQLAKQLPVKSLPVSDEVQIWLAQLGILTLAELAKIPKEYACHRLGREAATALDLVDGVDERPLKAYCPVDLPVQTVSWDEPITGSEPLLFVLRGVCGKIAARLEGRGLAAQKLRLTLSYDQGVAAFRGVPSELIQEYELAAPLFRDEEIWKVLSSRLGRTRLQAPSVGLKLEVLQLTHAAKRQLELAKTQSKLTGANPETLAVLFGELSADVGSSHFGFLRLSDSHRPEKVSLLQPASASQLNDDLKHSGSRKINARQAGSGKANPHRSRLPNRLLSQPITLTGPIRSGALLSVGQQIYSIKKTAFEKRLDAVEWWSDSAVSRDYVRVWLENASSALEVLVYIDRTSGQRFLQAIYD